MRTTIDLPEDLLRRAKAAAALRGMKLKDFVAAMLDRSMRSEGEAGQVARPKRRKLPVMIPPAGRKIPVMTNAELFEHLDRAEDEAHGRFP